MLSPDRPRAQDRAVDAGEIAGRYFEQIQETNRQLGRDNQSWRRWGWIRGFLFLLVVAAAITGWQADGALSVIAWTAAALLLICFLAAAAIQTNLELRITRSRTMVQLLGQARARCQRNWDQLVWEEDVRSAPPADRLAEDLDLVGRVSLFQLVATAHTPAGRRLLREWMHRPAEPEAVRQRQIAVSQLTGHHDWRRELEWTANQVRFGASDLERFARWADAGSAVPYRGPLVLLARITSAIVIATLIAWVFQWLPAMWAALVLGSVLAVHFVVSVLVGGRVHDAFNAVAARFHDFSLYRQLLRLSHDLPPGDSRLLEQLRHEIHVDGHALQAMDSLGRLIGLAEMRRGGVLFLLYVFLQLTFLYDAHVLDFLERWRTRHGDRVNQWLRALGEIEALAALATLAYENPRWTFPTMVPHDAADSLAATQSIRAAGLGHPLIPENQCVVNDVLLGGPGSVLLITGSNMSGKSTLLRSIGINVVLAHMGSVVCAREMTCAALHVETCIRKGDSLAEGLSLFMKELTRLRDVVRVAEQLESAKPFRLLYLFDEVLLGTNSKERHIAVAHILTRLTSLGAVGAVTTHDLELAHHPDLQKALSTVHFTETFETRDGRTSMHFDYRLRPGLATSTNALKLLEMVGLS